MQLKIRISEITVSEEDLVKQILSFSNSDTALIVQELDPKAHYHMYVDTIITIPTVRERLKEILPPKPGNKEYSISATHHDWDVYIGYLFKHDNTRIIHNKKYDKEEYLQKYNEYKKDGEKVYNETKKIKDYVIDMGAKTPREIGKLVMKYYIANNKMFHKANMGALVNTIYSQLNPDDETFLTQMLEEAGFEDPVASDARYYRQENERLRMRVRYEQSRHTDDYDDPE